MNGEAFEIDVGDARTTAIVYRAMTARATMVLAHGAGGSQRSPWMLAVGRALTERRFDVVTFDFLYTHAKRRLPDRNDVLEATWRAVVARVRELEGERAAPLFLGGKSMGGRIATQIAASPPDLDIAGLVLLGYPLHPPGKPERLRAAHLPRVRVPMLFVQGARDAFGTPEELRPILAELPRATLFVVEGADHSLNPPKRAATSPAQVMDAVAGAIEAFAVRA